MHPSTLPGWLVGRQTASVTDGMSVGAAILDELAQAGVEVVFGLPGVHNLPLWSAHQAHHPRIIGVRHEQAAVYAADGYARATGRLGVAITTTGPGAANAVAAFGEAANCGSPVLLISSDVSVGLRATGPGEAGAPRGILHEMNDQAQLFAAFADHGVIVTTARTPQAAINAVREAITAGDATPTGPRYVGIAADVLAMDSARMKSVAAPSLSLETDPATVLILADLIAGSKRVVLWAGGGVVQCGTEGERLVGELSDELAAPIVTTYAARGLLAEHPLIVTAPVHEPEVADLIAGADLLLMIGSDADGMNTRNWQMPLPAAVAAIGLGSALERTFDFDLLIQANLVGVLRQLREITRSRNYAAREPWADMGVSEVVRDRLRADERTVTAMALVDAMQQWPDEGVIVCDMAVAGYWVGGYAIQPRGRRLQYPVGWGTLGYALPAAIGPAAVGIPTLAVCGDGGPLFALGELATIAQERLPVTLLIVDDGGYGMLRFDQQVFGHPERGVDLLTPNWAPLAQAFGIAHVEVGADEVADVLAVTAKSPRMIVLRETLFPPRTTSPRWRE